MSKIKTTVAKASEAYRSLLSAKVTKMKDSDKFAIVKIMRVLKPIATEFQGFIDDAARKLMPEGFEAISVKLPDFGSLTKEERKTFDRYNTDVNRCVAEEGVKEVTLEYSPISDEGFQKLIEGSDISLGEMMNIYDLIVR